MKRNILSNIIGILFIIFIHSLSSKDLLAQCNSELAYWDFNDCTKGNMIKDGTPPTTTSNGGCTAMSVSLSRISPGNSCVSRGNGDRGNCFGGNDLPAWVDNSDKALVGTVTFPAGSTGKLSGLNFTLGLHDIVDWNGQPNHYPTKWGIRVLKNGVEIFKQIDNLFVVNSWTPITFDWSSNPAFEVSGATVFKIEILGYAPGSVNSSSNMEVWEIDDFKIIGGCCTLPSSCNLTSANLSSVVCKDNNTPSNAPDDYIEFKLNPTGTGIGSKYIVTVSGGAIVTPNQASYGSNTTFRLQNGSAGSGNKVITIKDKTNTNCVITVPLPDPGSCSTDNMCNFTDSGLNNVSCNDNGTPDDPNDDKIIFSLNPTGNGIGNTYSVNVSGYTVTPLTGTYGVNTTFMVSGGSAGSGTKIISIADNQHSSCGFSIPLTDPGSCSSTCSPGTYPICPGESYTLTATSSSLSNISWQKLITGVWTDIAGQNGISYVATTTGSYKYTATDANGCAIELCCPFVIVDGSCPGTCSINTDGLSNISCNDNSTPNNVLDDYISFSLNPTGTGLGSATYSISSNYGVVNPTSGSFGVTTNFSISPGSAGSGSKIITIHDNTYTTCSKNITIPDPGNCSCTMNQINLSTPECSNGGTPSPNDDFIKFTIDPNGTAGETYSVSISSGTITPNIGVYGSPTLFILNSGSAGGGNKTITITDDTNESCKISVPIIDPGTCSNCQILEPLTALALCDNKNTVTTADDEWVITTDPSGLNLSATYSASVSCSGTPCPGCNKTGLTYGTSQEICRLPINFIPYTITISDASGGTCMATQDLYLQNCSPVCSISLTANTGTCNPINNQYTLSGQLSFANAPSTGTLTVFVDALSQTFNAPFTSPQNYSISGLMSDGASHTVSAYFSVNSNCMSSTNYNAPFNCTCTPPTATANVTQPSCIGANAPDNGAITITGFNAGERYQYSTGSSFNSGGAIPSTITNIPAGGIIVNTLVNITQSYTIRIYDSSNNNCFIDRIVDIVAVIPPSVTCSKTDITNCTTPNGTANANATGVTYLWNNGATTPVIYGLSEGTYTVTVTNIATGCTNTCSSTILSILNVPGVSCTPFQPTCANPTGGSIHALPSGGTSPYTYLWSNGQTGSTATGLAAGTYAVTITDSNGCSAVCSPTTINAPTGCCLISITATQPASCDDNGTLAINTDDRIKFSLNVSNTGASTNFLVTVNQGTISPSVGTYGQNTEFTMQPGSAGQGDILVTITDTEYPDCNAQTTITDPKTCSPASVCVIGDPGLKNITCHDNGTANTGIDDYTTFTLNPTGAGNLEGYTITVLSTGFSVTPTAANYGTDQIFTLKTGSASAKKLKFRIMDNINPACTLDFEILSNGTCSNCTNPPCAPINVIKN